MAEPRTLFRWESGQLEEWQDGNLYVAMGDRVTLSTPRYLVAFGRPIRALLARIEALEGALREADDLVVHLCFRLSDPKTKPRREIDRAGEYVTRWRSLLDPEAPGG